MMKHLLMAVTIALALAHHVALAAPDAEQAATSVAGTPPAAAHVKPAAQSVIYVDAGSGRVLQLTTGAASVFAADPKIAEVRPASATSLFIFGVSRGSHHRRRA
jgi:pilus assembly protein CpaC